MSTPTPANGPASREPSAGGEHGQALPASFRDPAGFMFRRDGTLYRQINAPGKDDYDRLMQSGLHAALAKRGWLVTHREAPVAMASTQEACLVIEPELIEFVSYPYEWCFSELQDAALLTLDAQRLALEHGMSLKDASAYNVQFRDGRPILIDTLSFERYVEGKPWVAYRQFCQHFLAPLALMAHTDIRLGMLLRTCIDGLPLDLASRLLPGRTRLRLGLGMHIHMHARAQRQHASTADPGKPARAVTVSRRGLDGILQGLRGTVAGLDWLPAGTEWADYYQATNYTGEAFADKHRLVAAYLETVAPRSVWDLGANNGAFSRIAAGRGAATVAFDIDPAAVEANYRKLRAQRETGLLPLLLDLTNPSPGLGWDGHERDSLQARGPADCIMALALIHHLAISNNVPLDRIASFLAPLCGHLIIEFVPKSDGQVQRLLRSREDIFDSYDPQHFESAFSHYFDILRCDPIKATERVLYLLRSKPIS